MLDLQELSAGLPCTFQPALRRSRAPTSTHKRPTMQQIEQQQQQPVWPPLPGGPPPPMPGYQGYEPPRFDQQPPRYDHRGGFPAPPHGPAPEQQQQQKRKKRGKRGSGLEARQRGLKRQQQQPPPQTALGFFGQVPAGQHNVPASLQDLRRENRARAAQHFGGGGGGGGRALPAAW